MFFSDTDTVSVVVSADPNTPPRYLFVGSRARRDRLTYNHMYAKAVILGTNNVKPTYITVSFFKDDEERTRYKKETQKIEDEMYLFVEKVHSGVLTNEALMFVLEHVWVPLVHSFVADWGKDMVPHEIRWSYSDVSSRLEIPKYDWPHNEDPDDDVVEYLAARSAEYHWAEV